MATRTSDKTEAASRDCSGVRCGHLQSIVARAKLFLDRNARRCAVLAAWTALGRLDLEKLLQGVRNEVSYLSLRQVSRTSRECGVLGLEVRERGAV
jgi:hypothetical protein